MNPSPIPIWCGNVASDDQLQTVRVPFQLCGEAQPLILLPAQVNGHGPFSFVLDTGAAVNLITNNLAAVAGIEAAEVRSGTGAAGAVTVGVGMAASLCVGDACEVGVRIAITDELLRIGEKVGKTIDGAVGYEFLQRFCVTIDYRRRIATFSRSIDGDATGTQTPIPFRLAKPEKPLVLVEAFVNDDGPFQFALDTGASMTTLSGGVASRLALNRTPMPAATGAGGAVQAEAARVESVRVGDAAAGPLGVVITNVTDVVSRVLGEPLDGILGYNFLRNFEVVIDYPRTAIALSDGG